MVNACIIPLSAENLVPSTKSFFSYIQNFLHQVLEVLRSKREILLQLSLADASILGAFESILATEMCTNKLMLIKEILVCRQISELSLDLSLEDFLLCNDQLQL
jgi:hypothetical protein